MDQRQTDLVVGPPVQVRCEVTTAECFAVIRSSQRIRPRILWAAVYFQVIEKDLH